ncbi:COG1361 family protein [Lutibacter citreus]|uniref:hypothetical protein n=1 Tax=Lutibacter citreus TaxID=2138210 RepID=UPI000DBE2BCA|nr:hypothetical protein [Lutibacter citreus]
MKETFRYIIPTLIIIVFIYLITNNQTEFDSSDYLSFGMIFLTYFYVIFTWEMLERMRTESHLEKRPYLIADFDSPKSNLSFYIKNIGKTPAKNVKIKVNPDIKLRDSDTINTTLFKGKIEFYPPSKKTETYITTTSDFFKNNPDKFTIDLEYMDSFNNKFTEVITLDLNHHKKQSYIVEKELKDLIKSLENIKKAIEKK